VGGSYPHNFHNVFYFYIDFFKANREALRNHHQEWEPTTAVFGRTFEIPPQTLILLGGHSHIARRALSQIEGGGATHVTV